MEDGAEIQHDMGKLKYKRGLKYINTVFSHSVIPTKSRSVVTSDPPVFQASNMSPFLIPGIFLRPAKTLVPRLFVQYSMNWTSSLNLFYDSLIKLKHIHSQNQNSDKIL